MKHTHPCAALLCLVPAEQDQARIISPQGACLGQRSCVMARCIVQHSKPTPGADTLRYSLPHLPALSSKTSTKRSERVCLRVR